MAQVEYTPTQWADGADGGTPINAEHLNNRAWTIRWSTGPTTT